MLYLVRLRLKDSVTPGDLPELNSCLDDECLPAMRSVEGVNGAETYNSIHGDLVTVLDVENLATIDRAFADPALGATLAGLMRWGVRAGPGEVMFDRGTYQAFYAAD